VGALIQSTTRLVPNSKVEIRFAGRKSSPICGRIVRSYVSAIDAEVVFYRSAIAFDQAIDLSAIDAEDG
jgi:hypothetical protein